MRHNHDFDLASSTYLTGGDCLPRLPEDRSSAPRGIMLGIVIGLGLWAIIIAGIVISR